MKKKLKAAYLLATSGVLDNAVIIKTLTRDHVCDHFGCPSEEYCPSDWEQELKICDTIDEFLEHNDTDGIRSIKVVGYINGSKICSYITN